MDATDLAYAGAARQAELIAAGEVSPAEVLDATLARVEQLNPRLNAYRTVMAAQAREAAARAGLADGPLRGVPVAIKDDADVAGEATAWGTDAHRGPVARDGEVVSRLRAAGALIIGKTLVPEMTMLPATDTTTFGSARNPWDTERTPGGSSGGSAAAAAAGMCGVALGSDGAGSIRGPANWCGLFGLKPTRDRVPVAPHLDAWQGMSVNGPLARRVADAALFLDATVQDCEPGAFADAARRAEPGRLRIAVSTKQPPGALAPLGDEERRAVEATAGVLRELGHEVVERDPDYAPDLWGSCFARVLRGIHDDVEEAMPNRHRLERRTRGAAKVGGAIPGPLVRRVRAAEARQAARMDRLFEDCDALLMPGCAEGPYRVGEAGAWGTARFLAVAARRIPYFAAFNLTGQPAIAVPAGSDDDGLPVGVQVVGRRGADELLIALGAQLEQRLGWPERRPPL